MRPQFWPQFQGFALDPVLHCLLIQGVESPSTLLLPQVLKAWKYLSLRLLLPTYLSASPGKPSPLSGLLFHSFCSPGTEWVLKYLLRDELECQTQRGCLLLILSGVAWSPAHLLHQAVDRRGLAEPRRQGKVGVRDLLGGLVGKTASTAGGVGLIPVQGTKILHATCCGQKKSGDQKRCPLE